MEGRFWGGAPLFLCYLCYLLHLTPSFCSTRRSAEHMSTAREPSSRKRTASVAPATRHREDCHYSGRSIVFVFCQHPRVSFPLLLLRVPPFLTHRLTVGLCSSWRTMIGSFCSAHPVLSAPKKARSRSMWGQGLMRTAHSTFLREHSIDACSVLCAPCSLCAIRGAKHRCTIFTPPKPLACWQSRRDTRLKIIAPRPQRAVSPPAWAHSTPLMLRVRGRASLRVGVGACV